jgi:hypothetical protein
MRNLCLGVAVTAVIGLAAPLRAEVFQQSEAGFIIRQGADVSATPQEAWAALIRPSAWWSKQRTYSGDAANLSLDPRIGGCFCEVLPSTVSPKAAPRGGVEHMRVIFVDEWRALRLSGGLGPLQSEAVIGTLTISLKPREGGTRILWEYVVGGMMRYKTAEIAPSVDAVLGEQLQWLALKLGFQPSPSAPEQKPERGTSGPPDSGR